MRSSALTVRYGKTVAVGEVNLEIAANEVLALIGPSGCGKSTFLRSLNRMNDTVPTASVSGQVELDGASIYGAGIDPVLVRKRVGMVFQQPQPFPSSIFDNIAYAAPGRRNPLTPGRRPNASNERSARPTSGDEVKDRLTNRARAFPAASSSACASLARSPSSPRSS